MDGGSIPPMTKPAESVMQGTPAPHREDLARSEDCDLQADSPVSPGKGYCVASNKFVEGSRKEPNAGEDVNEEQPSRGDDITVVVQNDGITLLEPVHYMENHTNEDGNCALEDRDTESDDNVDHYHPQDGSDERGLDTDVGHSMQVDGDNFTSDDHEGFPLFEDCEDDMDEVDAGHVDLLGYDAMMISSTQFRSFYRRLRAVLSWDRLLSLLCLDGKVRFSELQYFVLRTSINTCEKATTMMDVRSVRKILRPILYNYCYPRSRIIHVHENEEAQFFTGPTSTLQPDNGGKTSALNCVRLILPSEWAKVDVCTLPFYRSVFECPFPSSSRDVDIEFANIVRNRADALMKEPVMKAMYETTKCSDYARPGDIIYFPCSRLPALREHGIHGWDSWTKTMDGKKEDEHMNHYVKGRIGATVGVGFDNGWNRTLATSCSDDMPEAYLDAERIVLNNFRRPTKNLDKHLTSANRTNRDMPCASVQVDLYPGDSVHIIRPTADDISEGTVCVLLASPVSNVMVRPCEKILWLEVSTSSTAHTTIRPMMSTNVVGLPYFYNSEARVDMLDSEKSCRSNRGILPNGERYVIYRMALYADGFQQNKSTRQSRSIGGIYLLPLGLSNMERTCAQAVRVLSLTPPGCPMAPVLKLIIDDISQAAREGVKGVDPNGNPIRIYIDPVCLMGDLPQAAAYTDVLGHSSNAMCTLCFTRRRKNQMLPETNYSCEFHFARCALCRFDARREAIRQSNPDKQILRRLGMEWEIDSTDLPGVYFSRKMGIRRDQAQSTENRTTAPPTCPQPLLLDHALSIPALPDHLVSTLVSGVMTICFDKLRSDEKRAEIEMRIVDGALANGLDIKRHILRWERSKKGVKYNGMAGNSMSSWFSILVIASCVFSDVYNHTRLDAHLLPRKLQSFVSVLYRWPKPSVEGSMADDWDFKSRRHQLLYQHIVADRGLKFLSSARDLYVVDREAGKYLDRPFTHRMLELIMNTVPTFGHARICSELVLEQTHQQFKTWFSNNTHSTSHITAMDKAIARDWLWRLSCLHSEWRMGTPENRQRAETGMKRLVLGEDGVWVNELKPHGRLFMEEFRSSLSTAMKHPIPTLLEVCEAVNTTWTAESSYAWATRGLYSEGWLDEDFVSILRDIPNQKGFESVRAADLQFFRKARFMRAQSSGRVRAYPHNVVGVGDAISVVVSESMYQAEAGSDIFMDTVEDGKGICTHYVISSIIGHVISDDVWIIGKELRRVGRFFNSSAGRTSCFRLTSTCRRVAAVHQCTGTCVQGNGRSRPVHSASLLNGGTYHIISRRNGYPPFLG